jgi:hypothetical protein
MMDAVSAFKSKYPGQDPARYIRWGSDERNPTVTVSSDLRSISYPGCQHTLTAREKIRGGGLEHELDVLGLAQGRTPFGECPSCRRKRWEGERARAAAREEATRILRAPLVQLRDAFPKGV